MCCADHDDYVDNDRNCDNGEHALTEFSVPNRLHVALPLTSREACSMSPEGVVLRAKTCGIGPIRAHHRPKSKRMDTSKQKSSPTSRHKTTPEQFKHIFATSLHGPQWSQSRSKLKELTSGAVREASFTPREPRNGCPNQAIAHRRCEFYQCETHVFRI